MALKPGVERELQKDIKRPGVGRKPEPPVPPNPPPSEAQGSLGERQVWQGQRPPDSRT